MNTIVLTFVAVMCIYVAMKIFSSEERNTVFNKRPIEVVDVKKYNKFCGTLVLVFGAVAEITIYFMCVTEGVVSALLTLLVIAEALTVMVIYNKVEFKMLKKR